MSFIISEVVQDGIVMAADSACSSIKMFDEQDVHNPLNVITSRIITRSIPKIYVMKANNIAIAQGHQTISPKTRKPISPYIDFFCRHNYFDNPGTAATELLHFIQQIDPDIGAIFHVAGYNPEGYYPVSPIVDGRSKGKYSNAL